MMQAPYARGLLDLLGPMLSFAYARDRDAFEEGFDGLDGVVRDALGHLVLRRVAGDWPVWGWASNHIRWAYLDGAGDALAASSDRSIAEKAALARASAPDPRRKRLTRLAFTLIKTGTAARPILQRLHAENENFAHPLPPAEVQKLAVWCARNAQ